ncbi:MAG: AAA family ATPase, partial [Chlamydiia bacterium]|nr:AAA family ATPase [Chlamydiia bacterium]
MSTSAEQQFGPIRSILWPIKNKELKIVLPMLLMLFMVCFNYSILRNLKDVLVVTAAASGGEIIPFIKVWAMLPMAVLSALVFTKLTNRFSQEVVYYIMIGGFLVSYAFFGFVIYPMGEQAELTSVADFLERVLPAGYRGMVAMVRHWSFTFFYVMCELWGSIVLTVLFWGFANEITKVKDAKRFYSLYAVVSSFSAVLAGYMGMYFSRLEYNPNLPFGKDAWEQTIMEVVLAVVIVGVGIIVAFWWMNKYVLNSKKYSDLHEVRQAAPKIKKKQSLRASFAYLAQSKYLICIAIIVVSYNLVINLVEVVWKDQLKLLYPNKDDYFVYLSNVTVLLGLISSIAAFFVGSSIQYFGWTKTALVTPVLILVTSLG